jgi:hypothetical protein
MISKSFIIKALIALIILVSSLTSSVNAAAIAPARQFLRVFQPRTKRALLTSDLGFSRHDHEGAALSAIGTPDNEMRSGEFLFLDLVDRG